MFVNIFIMQAGNHLIQLLYDIVEPYIEKAFNYPLIAFVIFLTIIILSLIAFYSL